jgi:hypothetical protein
MKVAAMFFVKNGILMLSVFKKTKKKLQKFRNRKNIFVKAIDKS